MTTLFGGDATDDLIRCNTNENSDGSDRHI
jgi:hypothetical protein